MLFAHLFDYIVDMLKNKKQKIAENTEQNNNIIYK